MPNKAAPELEDMPVANQTTAPAAEKDLRGLGKNLCQAIRECPASQYLICGCLETEKNCWDIEDKPCCKRDEYERCLGCDVYLKAVAQEG